MTLRATYPPALQVTDPKCSVRRDRRPSAGIVTLACCTRGRLCGYIWRGPYGHADDILFVQIRQSAGLLLKNNLKQQYAGSPPAFQEYIKVMSPLRRLMLCSRHAPKPWAWHALWHL